MQSNREFLGQGWSFPVTTDAGGEVELSAGEADIRESVRLILGTAKGERVMRPDFGCGIHDHVFTTVNATTLTLVETEVREALTRWEPRIEVRRVDGVRADADPSKLLLTVEYRVRETNNEHNLVYPFYLHE